MARKKIYENRVSDIPHRLKLFESTQSYVAQQQKLTGRKQVEIIRELCHFAHQEELSKGQFSLGTTKIFRSAQSKILKQNVNEPLNKLTQEVRDLRREIQDIDIHTRFASDEIFRVLRAFFIENQILVELVHMLTNDNNQKINLVEARKKLQDKYESGFENRLDSFYEKYQRTIQEKTEEDLILFADHQIEDFFAEDDRIFDEDSDI